MPRRPGSQQLQAPSTHTPPSAAKRYRASCLTRTELALADKVHATQSEPPIVRNNKQEFASASAQDGEYPDDPVLFQIFIAACWLHAETLRKLHEPIGTLESAIQGIWETICNWPAKHQTAAGGPGASNSPSGPNHSTSTSSTGPSKARNTPRSKRKEDQDPPDRRDKRRRSDPSSKALTVDPERRFACPFWVSAPGRYDCPGISRVCDVRTHIKRSHSVPIHCPTCGEVFQGDGASRDRDQHIMERCCNAPSRPFTFHAATEEHMDKLAEVAKERENIKKSHEERWFLMWDVLFDGRPRPPSPYIEVLGTPFVTRVRDMVDRFLSDEVLISQQLAPWFLASQEPAMDRYRGFLLMIFGQFADFVRDQDIEIQNNRRRPRPVTPLPSWSDSAYGSTMSVTTSLAPAPTLPTAEFDAFGMGSSSTTQAQATPFLGESINMGTLPLPFPPGLSDLTLESILGDLSSVFDPACQYG
ncbi:hypothetical protein F4778DRAFT_330124 [Xylariomycetidae sp. FL2044]|nr:hypothetical protein F4778DRAFT_330124 [Xylariomycetidae sp. FL2044]